MFLLNQWEGLAISTDTYIRASIKYSIDWSEYYNEYYINPWEIKILATATTNDITVIDLIVKNLWWAWNINMYIDWEKKYWKNIKENSITYVAYEYVFTSNSWWGWSLSITPIVRYDWELVEWVFDEVYIPDDIKVETIIATLEVPPSWTPWVDDLTVIMPEYTSDWWNNWYNISMFMFSSENQLTNWILVKEEQPLISDLLKWYRIRFNVLQTAVFAGSNLKIYFL